MTDVCLLYVSQTNAIGSKVSLDVHLQAGNSRAYIPVPCIACLFDQLENVPRADLDALYLPTTSTPNNTGSTHDKGGVQDRRSLDW